jgi:threonine/homoserine/homoserine lactone efflux protein
MPFHAAELLAYTLAVVVLILTPGPNMILVLTRSIAGGPRAGLVTSLGVELGTLVHTLLAAVGISAIVATSALAFNVVKLLGAVYLIYIGVRALLSKENSINLAGSQPVPLRQTFWQAVLTNILNPKVALFFLAFIPQFIHPERGLVFLQFLVLGSIIALVGFSFSMVLTFGSSSVSGWLRRNPTFQFWQEKITGLVFIGLGLRLALIRRE